MRCMKALTPKDLKLIAYGVFMVNCDENITLVLENRSWLPCHRARELKGHLTIECDGIDPLVDEAFDVRHLEAFVSLIKHVHMIAIQLTCPVVVISDDPVLSSVM